MQIIKNFVLFSILICALLQVNAYPDEPISPDQSVGMDCTYKDETYEEGVGIYDTDIACRMFVCEYGVMKPFFTKCFMDGKCYDEGQKWTSGCEQYICILTSRGYLPQRLGRLCFMDGKCYEEGESWSSDCVDYTCKKTDDGFVSTVTNKQCKFERKGKVKCLPNEAVVRDGPCIKRQCKISEVKDGVNTEMVLLRDFGGCGYAKGCRELNEIWTYRCITKQCVTDGWNFVKISLQPRCIRRGHCYSHGESYTTKTCMTRTCQVNVLVQKAWFEETKRQCRYDEKCIDEGQSVVKKCVELTCSKVTKKGKIRYVMKRTGNVCKQQTSNVY